ncbi:hypothetical protein M1146_06070 [Patescibacteria group bacterium]|nr:hypothetical protein [Patescibacteria group bacterium]
MNDEGRSVAPNTFGNIIVETPLPPGCMIGVHKNEKTFKKYFESFETGRYYDTGLSFCLSITFISSPNSFLGDAGVMDADGYLYVMARTDDIINVSGVRIATGAIEEGVLVKERGIML